MTKGHGCELIGKKLFPNKYSPGGAEETFVPSPLVVVDWIDAIFYMIVGEHTNFKYVHKSTTSGCAAARVEPRPPPFDVDKKAIYDDDTNG